jgi:hypothetical protein
LVSIDLYERYKKSLPAFAGTLFLLGCGTIFLFDPMQSAFYPPCFFKKLTGLNCPGCGSSRALHQLMHGDVLAAIDYNFLLVIFLPVVIIGLISVFTGRLNNIWQKFNKPWLYFFIITAFWILRNLPYQPFFALNADR